MGRSGPVPAGPAPDRVRRIHRRSSNVVGIFPNRASLVRMVATLLQEQDDEWQVADRRYFSVGSMT
jgi:transposase-like protein